MREKYYLELNEIPLYNFEKCLEGNYSYIRKDNKDKWGKNEVIAFYNIYEKYIQKYYKKDLETKVKLYKSIIQLECAFVESSDDYFLTQIEIKKAQIPKVTQKKEGTNTTEVLLILGKFQGIRLSPVELTVDEYFTLIKLYERENKKI